MMNMDAATVVPLLKRGRQVRILGGPLNGLEGFVDDPSNPKGIVISVDVLRQGMLLKCLQTACDQSIE